MNLFPLVPSPSIGTTNEVAARSHVTQESSQPCGAQCLLECTPSTRSQYQVRILCGHKRHMFDYVITFHRDKRKWVHSPDPLSLF